MTKRLSIVMPFLFLSCLLCAQSYESWIDGDYNHRKSGMGTSTELIFSHDVSALPSGIHFLNVRTKTANGTWGSVTRQLFIVPGLASETAKVYECWIDGDYDGRVFRQITNAVEIATTLDVSLLTPGIHYYNMRCRDAHGVWGSVNRYLFIVTDAVHPTYIEYWIDSDTLTSIHQPVAGNPIMLDINVSRYEGGMHTFNCRLMGNNGQWTKDYTYPFTLDIQQQDSLTHEPIMAEYFFDNDPGYGKATAISQVKSDSEKYELSVAGLQTGAHVLHVRSADADGHWSGTVAFPLYVKPQEAFLALEYFFDEQDPGTGKATALPNPRGSIDSLLCHLPTKGLSIGNHTLNVRGLKPDGQWSDVVSRPFLIIEHQASGFIEYFVDRDPGYGKAKRIQNIKEGYNRIAINLSGLPTGAHTLGIRSTDEEGHWSSTIIRPLYICRKATGITAMEYYFDNADPGLGKAFQVSIIKNASDQIVFNISVDGLTIGEHVLNVRTQDINGLWSVATRRSFTTSKKLSLRGDVNDDGEIGMPDVMYTVNYILGAPADDFNEEAADLNKDGEIGMPDVMFIVNHILNGKFPDE